MRPQGIPKDYIKMKAFPFSLDGVAKDWLYLQLVLFNTWGDMKRMFLKKFFLVFKTVTIKKEICGISMIDAASGGALMDNTPVVARHLISNMASNTQQFGIRGVGPFQMVNEIVQLENQLTKLTSLVRQLAVGQHQPSIAARVYEIESDNPESVGEIGGYHYERQPYQSQWFDNQQFGRQKFWPTESAIPSTTVLTTTTMESVISRQLTIFGGPNEAVSNKKSRVPAKHEL
ncbi:hypothetical protein CR513_35027, partial [Mucuna pruriens]